MEPVKGKMKKMVVVRTGIKEFRRGLMEKGVEFTEDKTFWDSAFFVTCPDDDFAKKLDEVVSELNAIGNSSGCYRARY